MERVGLGAETEKVDSHSIPGDCVTDLATTEEQEGIQAARLQEMGERQPVQPPYEDRGATLSSMGYTSSCCGVYC